MRAQTPVLIDSLAIGPCWLDALNMQDSKAHQHDDADFEFELHLDVPEKGNW